MVFKFYDFEVVLFKKIDKLCDETGLGTDDFDDSKLSDFQRGQIALIKSIVHQLGLQNKYFSWQKRKENKSFRIS